MSAIFVHLSDTHFGQERDQHVHINHDAKRQLISDARHVVKHDLGGAATGILVTGDIAHSGAQAEYEQAGVWLDELADAVECPTFRVQMIPGNHDVDRTRMSQGAEHLLGVIRKGGAEEYERVIANDMDRATLFARFHYYSNFCLGYQCPLDGDAKHAANLVVELAPGRSIRFIRMNSSLLCTGDEKASDPELMIGARQFMIPRVDGEENIVLVHHPTNWYKDAAELKRYIRSRSRVFISGHEHMPNVVPEEIEEGADLLFLAAGATAPARSEGAFTFTYNVIVFDWDEAQDALAVTIHPRAWNDERTRFEADTTRLGGKEPRFTLGSPNFKKAPRPVPANVPGADVEPAAEMKPVVEDPQVEGGGEGGETTIMPPNIDGYNQNLLRFFRDLRESERLRILVAFDAIPQDLDERLTQGIERKLFDTLAKPSLPLAWSQRPNYKIDAMASARASEKRDGHEHRQARLAGSRSDVAGRCMAEAHGLRSSGAGSSA